MKLIRNVKVFWALYWLTLVFGIWVSAFILIVLVKYYDVISLASFKLFLNKGLSYVWSVWSLGGLGIANALIWFIGASLTLSIKNKISNEYKFSWTYWFFWEFNIFKIGRLVKANKIILGERTNKRTSKMASISTNELEEQFNIEDKLPIDEKIKTIVNNVEGPITNNSYVKVDNKKALIEERKYENIEKEIAKDSGDNRIMDTEKIQLKSPEQEEFAKPIETKGHNIDNVTTQQIQYPQYTTPFGQPVMYTQPIQAYTLQGPQLQAPQYVTQTLQQPGSQIMGTTQRFVPVQGGQQNQIQPQMPNVDYTSVVDTSSIGHGQFPQMGSQIVSNIPLQTTQQHAFEMNSSVGNARTFEFSAENLSASALEKLRTLNFILENGGISYQEYYKKKKSIYMVEFDQEK